MNWMLSGSSLGAQWELSGRLSQLRVSLLTVSINCSVHVAFVTWLESPENTWLLWKVLVCWQIHRNLKITNLGKRSSSLPRGKMPQCQGLSNSFNGGIHDSIQSFWMCSNPSNIEFYAISLWCWHKFHYWCAPWVWRFANVETMYETKIQWSKLCYIEMRFHTIRSSWSNT